MHDSMKELLVIFEETLALEEQQRIAFLDDLKGKSPELYQKILRLLNSMEEADHFFGQGLYGEDCAPLQIERNKLFFPKEKEQPIPEFLGPFRILKLLGRGGMGSVYHAVQDNPVREVALKVVNGCFDKPDTLIGFKRECQALALMNDDRIARIYDVRQTEENEPYCVMEFVPDGLPITDFCDQERLDIRERIELYLQICQGVGHAHTRGIIHGDLKPSNILVTVASGKPHVKVIDFGIARAIGDGAQVRLSSRPEDQPVGTLAYMSPEQTETGPIDTRSDIYALGILLFQMLSGFPMKESSSFLSASIEEKLHRIRERPHPMPGELIASLPEEIRVQVAEKRNTTPERLRKRVHGDLDWISSRALKKQPAERYATVNDLKKDLEAHLQNLPVDAVPQSRRYLIEKFVRRHLVITLASVSIALIFLVSFVITSISLANTREARSLEAEARHEAELTLDRLLETHGFYKDILTQPHPYRSGPDVRLLDVLEMAETRLKDKGKRPELEARLRSFRGEIYLGLGMVDKAEQDFSTSMQLNEMRFGRQSRETLSSMNLLGISLRLQRRLDEAEALFLEIKERTSELPEASQDLHFEALNGLAIVYRLKERFPEATSLCQEIRGHYVSRGEVLHQGYLMATVTLANIYRNQGAFNEAAVLLEEAATYHRELDGETHPRTLLALNELAGTRYAQQEYEEAIEAFGEVASLREEILGVDHPRTLDSWEGQALSLLYRNHEVGKAAEMLEEILARRRKVQGKDNHSALKTLNGLATAYSRLGRTPLAIQNYEDLLTVYRQNGQDGSAEVLRVMNNLGDALIRDGRPAEAIPLLHQTYERKAIRYGANALTTLKTGFTLAEACLEDGNSVVAVELFADLSHRIPLHYPGEKHLIALANGYYVRSLIQLNQLEAAENCLLWGRDVIVEPGNEDMFNQLMTELRQARQSNR